MFVSGLLLAAVLLLPGGPGVGRAASTDTEPGSDADLRAAAELLDELSITSNSASGETMQPLLAQAPLALARLDAHTLDVPPLVRLMLSGQPPLEPGGDDGTTALPVLFSAAADELRATSDESGGASVTPDARSGLDVPSIPWVAGLLIVAVICPLAAAMAWYRRRADRAEQLSLVDPLTGLANRRRLDQDLARLEAVREAARRPISLAMIDVDDFKRYNDTFGHREGDAALRQVGAAIASVISTASTGAPRSNDSVYRYGGEEFLLLLSDAPKPDAVATCEAVRLAVAGLPSQITVSIGVATGIDEPLSTLTVAADEALYRAKANGRDQVVATEVANRSGARVSSI